MISIKVQSWQVYKAVYDMCRPVGMGFLQLNPDDMTEEKARELVERAVYANHVHMDYVFGRQCKFSFEVTPGSVIFDDEHWYDHTRAELDALILNLISMEE